MHLCITSSFYVKLRPDFFIHMKTSLLNHQITKHYLVNKIQLKLANNVTMKMQNIRYNILCQLSLHRYCDRIVIHLFNPISRDNRNECTLIQQFQRCQKSNNGSSKSANSVKCLVL